MKKRILHINSAWGKGGAAVTAQELIQALALHFSGKIRVVVGDNYSSDTAPISINSIVHRLLNVALCRFLGQDGSVWPWNRRLKTLQNEIASADLIHLHNLHGYYFPLRFLNLMRDKPVVWTLHDYWVLTGRCTSFRSCLNWQNTCGCPHKDFYPKTYWDRSRARLKEKQQLLLSLKHLTLVPVSHTQASWIRSSYLRQVPTTVIYNGIDAPTLRTKPRRDPSRKFTIVYCYSPSNVKGPDLALGILSALDPRQFQLKLFGNPFERSFRIRLEQLGVRFEHLGRINEKSRLFAVYHDGDLFMSTSRDESFGRTTVESMLAGTPVIAFDLPIMHELLGRYGTRIPCFDTVRYAEAISAWIHSASQTPSNELQQYAQRFLASRMVTEYCQVYQHCGGSGFV